MWTLHATPAVNDQSAYPTIVSVAMSMTSIMLLTVVLRAYVRYRVVKAPGMDDYVTFLAAVTCIIYNVLAVYQTRLGLGLPVSLRPKPSLAQYSVIQFSSRPVYMLGITCYKVALCFAYLRFVSPGMIIFRRLTWSLMGFIIISHFACTLVIILQCRPFRKSFEASIPGSCLPLYPTWNATAAITIACDIIIFLLPVPVFAKLQIDRRRKLGLIFLFVLGLFTTICSVMRMLQIRQVAKDGNNSTLVIWGTAEINVGIILTCLPTLVPLFRKHLRGVGRGAFGYTHGSERQAAVSSTRLKNLSRSPASHVPVMPRKAAARIQDSDEDSILAADDRGWETDRPWIRRTTEVHITRADRDVHLNGERDRERFT
ncbi:hypothetical protein B0A48_16815 [Cryoendolithus antarcticus]|uniref:Rhodopsin domain-containing protein n=1 Tax=Cryoendolithus antarcticus TaxID=1507870 RepID=A0A1V8SDV3_9PEZI|nr:hypothetical protein B0A48_16815 [Cryoendolithus antarcticus]